MIQLYKPADNPIGESIEERLVELVVAYKLVAASSGLPSSHPWIRSGKEIYQTEEEIKSFLDVLTQEVNTNMMVSGDACFVDPLKGGPCL